MATLEIKDLHVSVSTEDGPKEILKGVTLTINGGETHAIMGPNGSGKSTLAYSIAGHPKYTVTGGSVTLDGADVLASQWKYVPVRRLALYIEESVFRGTQWAVFEPNDHALWAKMRRTIASFLVNEWRKGALFGLTPDEAFYVKCDDETNPAEGISLGQVVCDIGVAPVKPAEFVIFRLQQLEGGVSLVGE